MLNILMMILLFLSITFFYIWSNPYNGLIFSQLGEDRRKAWERKNQKISLTSTFLLFILISIMNIISGFTIYFILTLFLTLPLIYFIKEARKANISIFEGKIYNNKAKDYFLIYFPLMLIYISLWGHAGFYILNYQGY